MTAVANRETRWCPRHDSEIKRGTRRCRSCTTDLSLPVRGKRIWAPERLAPMRVKGQPTKRSAERWRKGYAA